MDIMQVGGYRAVNREGRIRGVKYGEKDTWGEEIQEDGVIF
jgi:hypothetical protein